MMRIPGAELAKSMIVIECGMEAGERGAAAAEATAVRQAVGKISHHRALQTKGSDPDSRANTR